MSLLISEKKHKKALCRSVDVPEQKPSFAIGLTEVGISGKTVWILVPEGRIPFTAAIGVDLPGTVRGIHMSRIEEGIGKLYDIPFPSPKEFCVELGRNVMASQQGARCHIRLSGKMPLLRKTRVSGRISLDTVDVTAETTIGVRDGRTIIETGTIGLGVCHITACPCTQAYNQILFGKKGGNVPQPTHSQRSVTRLTIESQPAAPSYEQLFDCLDTALHVTHDLMKRPDEAEIVLKSHRFPQFAEDAVREVARAAGEIFGGILPDASRISIESQSLESIHIHDVSCRLETDLGEILQCLQNEETA